MLGLLGSGIAAVQAETAYRLGAQDRLRVKVWEWRPASSDTFEWTALNGEFTVDAAGMVSLPLIGSVTAQGATTAELSALIASRLREVAGLIRPPNAAVEIAQYRPFYIVGAIERPGEYPYRPGMTVLQAVSIAGGFYRPDTNLSRFERETIVAQGDVRVSETQRIALTMRRDRLSSEARGEAEIAFSPEVVQRQREALVAQGMQEETLILTTRRQTLQSQVDLLTQANKLLEDELTALAAKTTTQTRQVELARRELQNINSLMTRGLSVSARQVAVEQHLAQMESQLLDLSLAAARTRQEMARNERSMVDLRYQRANDVLREMRETQTMLDHVSERIETFRGLLYDSQVTAPRQQLLLADEAARLNFQIVRRDAGQVRQIPVDLVAEVRPGDVVRIIRASVPRSTDGADATASGQTTAVPTR
ncbi:polysaccharide biosynthesis/export family protein [Phreatobacter sp.]|uniref:polysaccharide biosynthesis/export family protein n=1 Tax=Phreatobacter sp. TaxID=1966341 RepID=UPI003F709ABC